MLLGGKGNPYSVKRNILKYDSDFKVHSCKVPSPFLRCWSLSLSIETHKNCGFSISHSSALHLAALKLKGIGLNPINKNNLLLRDGTQSSFIGTEKLFFSDSCRYAENPCRFLLYFKISYFLNIKLKQHVIERGPPGHTVQSPAFTVKQFSKHFLFSGCHKNISSWWAGGTRALQWQGIN